MTYKINLPLLVLLQVNRPMINTGVFCLANGTGISTIVMANR